MKKPLAAIASAIVLACAPAFVEAAPLASADPAVVAATREMLATMKAKETMTAVLAQMERQMQTEDMLMAAAAINAKSNLTPEQKKEEVKKEGERLRASNASTHAVLTDPSLVDDLIAELVPLYAETYTLDEIRQLTAFYASPLGQKMQATAPALMKRSMEISRWFVVTRLPKTSAAAEQTVGK